MFYSQPPSDPLESPPPLQELGLLSSWKSSDFTANATIDYTAPAPYYFLVVKFEPITMPAPATWRFESTVVRGEWRASGPRVTSEATNRISITSFSIQTSAPYRLEVKSEGGAWSLYLIGVRR